MFSIIYMKLIGLLTLVFLLLGTTCFSQDILERYEDPVTIGDLSLGDIIVHVYKTKEDMFPFKEISIKTNSKGDRYVSSETTNIAPSKVGGFIIVNGLKSKDDVKNLAEGERVFEEIKANNIKDLNVFEGLISDYLKEEILNDNEFENQEKETDTESIDDKANDSNVSLSSTSLQSKEISSGVTGNSISKSKVKKKRSNSKAVKLKKPSKNRKARGKTDCYKF